MSGIFASFDASSLLVGLGAMGALLMLFLALADTLSSERNRLRRRLARLNTLPMQDISSAGPPTMRHNLADSSIESLDRLIKRLLPRPAKLRERLAQTGRRISLGEYVLVSALIGILVYLALAFLAVPAFASLLFALASSLGLPHVAVGVMIKRRRAQFIMLFPEAIDLIARGLRSGLPVTESIKAVGDELPDPIGIEFRNIIDSFGLGLTLEEALAAATKRIDVPEFRFFAVAIAIQRETGGNLTETLENLSGILRRRKQMKLKIRALSSEARASAMIVGALPFIMFLVLWVIEPNYVAVLLKNPLGHIFLGAGILSLTIGIFVLMRMVRFEI